jgi:Tfp pilus assembly protein PilF
MTPTHPSHVHPSQSRHDASPSPRISALSVALPACRIYWALGGDLKAEREYCHAQLLEAAAEEGPQQSEAFEWLGHWYVQVAGDELRARKCYQRALALDPTLVR